MQNMHSFKSIVNNAFVLPPKGRQIDIYNREITNLLWRRHFKKLPILANKQKRNYKL